MRRTLILIFVCTMAAAGAPAALAGEGPRDRPPTLRDRVDDLKQEIESLTEDIEDLGEPVEEFELFDQCAYTIGVTQYGTWGEGPGSSSALVGPSAGRRSRWTCADSAPRSTTSWPSPVRSHPASSATRMPARSSSTAERPVGRVVRSKECSSDDWGSDPIAFVVVAVAAALIADLGVPAQAKRIFGTKGPDKIVGTAKADVIKSRGGNDRIRGRGGRDRLFGGRGADRLNAVDGRRDRVVNGGPGRDVCRIDAADRPNVRGCETVKVAKSRGPGGPGAPGSRRRSGRRPDLRQPPGGGQARSRRSWPRAAQEDAPPTFSDPFYAITITLNASVDGLNGDELPISIEAVCDVPSGLVSQAAQLIGGDGVALITSGTKVFDAAGQQLTGDAAATALAGADTVSLKAQLQRPAQWRQDEDGQPVPTFRASRADITA